MTQNSKIEWCHHTFNPWRGCAKVSPGCANCYADAQAKRNPGVLGIWGPDGTRVMASQTQWELPLKWNAAAKEAGERHRVFCASMADVFEDWSGQVIDARGNPLWVNERGEIEAQALPGRTDHIFFDSGMKPLRLDEIRYRLFELIDLTPNLDWLLLSKRPENIARMMPPHFPGGYVAEAGRMNQEGPRPNVWLGTSVENQQQAEARIPHLLKVPAAVRFLSCEPLLGPLDLSGAFSDLPDCDFDPGVSWVIVGGESGPKARPMHPDWARSIRDQCAAASVPFLFKQWGEWAPWVRQSNREVSPADLIWLDPSGSTYGLEESSAVSIRRVGKHAAGRLLDGREWNEFPQPSLVSPLSSLNSSDPPG